MDSTKTKSKLAVIIPTFNLLDILKELIKSVVDYTNGDYQIYVIENGQKEETIKWLKSQENIKAILNDDNGGTARSWNAGIDEGLKDGCTHFALLSDDITISDGWWDACLKEFDSGSHVVSAYDKNQHPHVVFLGWFFLIDKEALDKIGYVDEQFYPFLFEDLDYSQRLVESGLKYSKADTKVVHLGSLTIGGQFNKKSPRNYHRIYRDNKQRFREKYPYLKFRM